MGKWNLLLLVIFLVPRCHCQGNKTRLLFDELDHLLSQIPGEYLSMYTKYRNCFSSLKKLDENFHTDIKLLQNIFEKYYNLTQLYNSGCRQQLSGPFSICEPFGCHKIEIILEDKSKLSLRTNNNNTNTNTNINNNNNNVNISVTVVMPPRKDKRKKKCTKKEPQEDSTEKNEPQEDNREKQEPQEDNKETQEPDSKGNSPLPLDQFVFLPKRTLPSLSGIFG